MFLITSDRQTIQQLAVFAAWDGQASTLRLSNPETLGQQQVHEQAPRLNQWSVLTTLTKGGQQDEQP